MKKFNFDGLLYFFTSLMFFYVQLRLPIAYIFENNISLETLFISLLLFKIGELLHEFINLRCSYFSVVSLFVSCICVPFFYTYPFIYLPFAFFMMVIRDTAVKNCSKNYKIFGRAIGFFIVYIWNLYFLISLSIVILLLCFFSNVLCDKTMFSINTIKNKINVPVYIVMFFHHIHYFSYAYSIPILIIKDRMLPFWSVGIVFFTGWAAYNAYEKILKPKWIYFIIGHMISGIALFMMFYCQSLTSIIVCWFLTGLGGGTVYMLNELVYKNDKYVCKDLNIHEYSGHIVGIILWSLCLKYLQIEYSFLFAFFATIITIFCAMIASFLNNKMVKKCEYVQVV